MGRGLRRKALLCSLSCVAKPAQDSPWEEQLRVLAPEGWREPTKREARMDGSLVGYQIFVCGYGRGRVKEYVKSGADSQTSERELSPHSTIRGRFRSLAVGSLS